MNVDAASLHSESGLDDGTGLHFGDLRIGDTQTAAAVTEHGVEFLERVNLSLDLFEERCPFLRPSSFWVAV